MDQALVEYARLYAGPAVRRLAAELNIDLQKVKPSGRKGASPLKIFISLLNKPCKMAAALGLIFHRRKLITASMAPLKLSR